MSFHPWFPRESIESLCSWQPGVSKVTPTGRIRTTDFPDWVKLAAQRKASCNICEQSQTPFFFQSGPGLYGVVPVPPALAFFLDGPWTGICSIVGVHDCPSVSTHVRADPKEEATVRHGPFSSVWPCPTVAPVGHSKSAGHSPQLRSSLSEIRSD